MEKIFLIIILTICCMIGNAQIPDWIWTKNEGGIDLDMGYDICTDASGNVIVSGTYYSPDMVIGSTVLVKAGPSGYGDIFIVKYDASGNVLWAKSEGGTYTDVGTGICTDASGNVIVTGTFESGSVIFGTTVLTNGGEKDIFIVKYDPLGNVLWAKSAGGSLEDMANKIATDAGGNIIITGYFRSDSATFGASVLINSGSSDIFTVKYDPSGNVLWANATGGVSDDVSNGISTDGNDVLITGYFESATVTFGTTQLTSAGGSDIFIVKYDASGNVLWAKSAGGISLDQGYGISSDPDGNVLVTGKFSSATITFGGTLLTNLHVNFYDIFTVKFDNSGGLIWAHSAGGSGHDIGTDICTDAWGNVMITGFYLSPSITLNQIDLYNAGGYDLFIIEYDSSGNFTWAKTLGAADNDFSYGICSDIAGNSLITGYFYSTGLPLPSCPVNLGVADILTLKIGMVADGKEDLNVLNNIILFPNPADDFILVESNLDIINSLVEIFNTSGEKICSEIVVNKTQYINCSGFAKGMYLLRVSDPEKEYSSKIFVVHN